MTPVAKTSEIPNFGKKAVSADGREVLLINIKGTIYACENECPHQGTPLTAAMIKDDSISCPRHGYRFSLLDGSCSDHPDLTLKLYPVQVSGDDILIDLA